MKLSENPCYRCEEETEGCRKHCKKRTLYLIKKELDRRKRKKYEDQMNNFNWLTEGQIKRCIKNIKLKGIGEFKDK